VRSKSSNSLEAEEFWCPRQILVFPEGFHEPGAEMCIALEKNLF
jgi:hypothetical protein